MPQYGLGRVVTYRWAARLVLIGLLVIGRVQPINAHADSTSVRDLTLGSSTAGRPITAVQIGNGLRKLVLIGDTHGGPEANTYRLLLHLIDYFRTHPETVPSTVRLYLIPTLNPDGLALGTRFNARGVDLNRNMNTDLDVCPENDWHNTVNGAYGIVSDTGGSMPETEVESRLIRDFLLDASGAIFYYSAGGELFPPYCEHAPSLVLAKVYAQAAGYTYTRYYPRYLITGGMHDWAGSMGIASFTPELWNGDDTDTEANLNAINTVLAHATTLLPLPEDKTVHGVIVPAIFWRYWQSHGGFEHFGLPLAPATQRGGRLVQYFERAILEMHPEAADTPAVVQLARIDRQAQVLDRRVHGVDAELDQTQLETSFTAAWDRGGGNATYGAPTSDITSGLDLVDGSPRIVQYFERVRLEYNPTSSTPTIQLSPLGWYAWQREHVISPTLAHHIR